MEIQGAAESQKWEELRARINQGYQTRPNHLDSPGLALDAKEREREEGVWELSQDSSYAYKFMNFHNSVLHVRR